MHLGELAGQRGGRRLNYFEKFSQGNTKPQNIISSEGAGKGATAEEILCLR